MKKLTLILLAFVAGSTLLFTGCQDPEPTEVKPTISFETGADYVSTDVTLEAGSEFKIGINADANENSGAMLTNLKMVRHFVNLQADQTITWDSTFNVNTYSIDFLVNAYDEEGTDTFIFTITDAEGETAEVSLDVTTEITSGPINEFTDITLGDEQSATGSSCASLDGTVYSLADAKENADQIDFMFYTGANDGCTVASPNDENAALVFNNTTVGLETWAHRNDTKLTATEMTAEEFDAVENDAVVVELATGADQTRITGLEEDGAPVVLAFVTEAGKNGLIKIIEVNDANLVGAPGSIIITIKVQE